MVRLIDTLVIKGLVQRSEDSTDRRAKLLCLTPEGQLIVARIKEIVTALENELLSSFSDSDIARFGQFILSLASTVNGMRSRVRR